MSVVNIAVMNGRILVLTDTLVYNDRMPVALCERKGGISKAGGFVTAARGSRHIADKFREINDTIADFDDAVDVWRDALPQIPGVFHGRSDRSFASNLFMAGYSRSLDRLAAIQLFTEFHDGSPVLTERELGKGIHLHPEFPGRVAAMLPKAADESVMERIALAQWKVQDQFSLPLCVGGCMWLFDVTSVGASERIIGTYPDYSTHAQRFGDPNAAVVMELTEGARAA